MSCNGDDDVWCDGNDVVRDGDCSDGEDTTLLVREGGDVCNGKG